MASLSAAHFVSQQAQRIFREPDPALSAFLAGIIVGCFLAALLLLSLPPLLPAGIPDRAAPTGSLYRAGSVFQKAG